MTQSSAIFSHLCLVGGRDISRRMMHKTATEPKTRVTMVKELWALFRGGLWQARAVMFNVAKGSISMPERDGTEEFRCFLTKGV